MRERVVRCLRETATSINGMHDQMLQPGAPVTLPEQLDRHENMLTAHMASFTSMKDALGPLYAAFSDEQKKTVGPMGMM